MSVEPGELMSQAWTEWQGHVVNGTLPLRRYRGSSDHSAVFITELAAREPSEVALKLVSSSSVVEDSQLGEWRAAAGLAHPHLIRLLETGRCQLDGMAYLYVVMEYADQSLAEVLRNRALTEDEAREMLLPTLNALAFLHNRNLVQGGLKPSNVLAVGDQLKLASDTVRRVGQARASSHKASIYDPPEARSESYSTAGDVWAVGVTLFESLTRSPPLGLDERKGVVPLPPGFSPTFRELVAWCLSRRPYDRPKVTEIEAWLRRRSTGLAPATTPQPTRIADSITPESALQPATAQPATAQPATAQPATAKPATAKPATAKPATAQPAAREQVARGSVAAGPKIPQPSVPRTAAPVSAVPATAGPEVGRVESAIDFAKRLVVRVVGSQETAAQLLSKWRSMAPLILGAVALLALGWTGVRVLSSHRNIAPPSVQAPRAALSQTPIQAPPGNSGSIARSTEVEATTLAAGIHEEMPDIPPSALRTIHGHVKVYVRVMVEQDGTVYAALADRPGPSRYFERLAIEAAKKWTFPPADTEAQRFIEVRFDFSRGGVTGHAVAAP